MELKESKIEDCINDVLEVSKASFRHFYTREKLLDRIMGKRYWLYLAKEKGRVVGYKIWYEEAGQIYSWLGAVHPNFRRRGIATKLMKIQFNVSKSLSYKEITVKTHEGHKAMIALLEKMGFKEVRRVPHHWGDDKEAIFYKRDLP